MSTLLVQRLETELSQELRYNNSDRCNIACFSPYLFLCNAPSGTFSLSLLNSDDDEIFSQDFDCDDIKASLGTTDNYVHVFYPVIPNSPVQIEAGLYTVKLSASGYTPTQSSYMGWIQQFENIQNEMDYTPTKDTQNPLAIRIKVWQLG